MAEEFISVQVHNEFAKRIEDENVRQNHRITELEQNFKMVHDKVNDRYLLMYSSSPINNIKYVNSKLIYGNTTDMAYMTMWNDSPNYPDYYEYYGEDKEKCNILNGIANVRKSNGVNGKYIYIYIVADAENNIEALTSTDQIEVITANHDISGFYELSD